jgi:hypothetical protein
VRLKRLRPNVPHHGEGPYGRPRTRGLMGGSAGAHVPQKIESGYRDSSGYQGSPERRNGRHTGKLRDGDTRPRSGSEGNSRGSPPPGVGKGKGQRGTPDTHLGTSGRGGSGRRGKGDNYKGKATDLSESPSHEWFEKLGSD